MAVQREPASSLAPYRTRFRRPLATPRRSRSPTLAQRRGAIAATGSVDGVASGGPCTSAVREGARQWVVGTPARVWNPRAAILLAIAV
jgi:hypothetical protein